jgi:hypothetical protein
MLKSIIRIAASALGVTLLMTGCAKWLDPAPASGNTPISFSAGSSLLRDDVTKASFESGASFYVFGAKTISLTHYPVFIGQEVTYDGNAWSYSPARFWDPNASQYDFLAISGPSSASGVSCTPSSLPLRATVTYSPTASQYDLLAACADRTDGSITPVDLEFHHMLSAVSVVVYNDSPTQSITLNSYGFKNLCTQATLTVEQDLNTPESGWVSPSYDSNVVLGDDDGAVLASGGSHYPTSTITDYMIPQALNPLGSSAPTLVLNYTYQETGDPEPTNVVTPIRLQDIKTLGSDEAITSWQPGVKYTYQIHIRMGGGIRVHVITTEWEEVNAETPGLMI